MTFQYNYPKKVFTSQKNFRNMTMEMSGDFIFSQDKCLKIIVNWITLNEFRIKNGTKAINIYKEAKACNMNLRLSRLQVTLKAMLVIISC